MAEEILGEAAAAPEEVTLPEGESLLTKPDNSEEKSSEEASEAAGEETDQPSGETDEKSEDGDANEDEDGAPEEYSDFEIPDGVEVDGEALETLKGQLKDIGANQAQAQQLIDLQIATNAKAYEAQVKAWTDTQDTWKDTAKNDEEYGKGNFDQNMVVARRGMREIGGDELAKALDETGAGNHPEIIRAFFRMGKAIGEDSFSIGGTSGSSDKSHADKIFHKHQNAG